MCCRYVTGTGIYELVIEELGMKETAAPLFPAGDVNPGTAVPVIASAGRAPAFMEAVWGFPKKDVSIINARSETLLQKPSFASSYESRRCLVPASGFYEWDSLKNKVLFTLPGEDVMYLAAIWNYIDDACRFVILTADANESMKPVHDRMPVVMGKRDAERWLGSLADAEDILKKTMPLLSLKRDEEQLSFL